jgi:Papain family cysteine protease
MAKKAVTDEDSSNRIANLVPSKGTEKDYLYVHAIQTGAVRPPPKKLPKHVDLRASWWDIGDQEKTGSCVGWASTDGLARYHFIHAGKLARGAHLSTRCTWMLSKETDEFTKRPESVIEKAGTSLKASLKVLRDLGCVPEELVPFHIQTTLYMGETKDFYAAMGTRRIATYYNLFKNLTHWRQWLATQGPILVGVKLDQTFKNATKTHGKLDAFKSPRKFEGHAALVVGYTADKRFIVRNSWGTKWGDHGFAYASEAYIQRAFFLESYGVTV